LILVNVVESLESLKVIFLFNYLNSTSSVFTEGQQTEDVAILLGLAVIFFGLALLSFQRRNVTVGAWPWQRARVSG
jgi:ABC-2 type transport system permease protein